MITTSKKLIEQLESELQIYLDCNQTSKGVYDICANQAIEEFKNIVETAKTSLADSKAKIVNQKEDKTIYLDDLGNAIGPFESNYFQIVKVYQTLVEDAAKILNEKLTLDGICNQHAERAKNRCETEQPVLQED